MGATLDVLQALLEEKPRFDHRFTLHHYGYSTPEQALAAVTREAAFAIRMDEEIGTLRAGKRADFTVVDRDPTAIPTADLRDVVVEATIFEGRVYPVKRTAP